MPTDSPPLSTAKDVQQVLLVTGMSGAGKSTALQVLEDLGWETIDNFPVRLLKRLLAHSDEAIGPVAIGIDARTRGFIAAKLASTVETLSAARDVDINILFLDSASSEIERRYNETRRRHPLAQGRPVREGITAERELLEPLRATASMVIDTSAFSSNQLQQTMREKFAIAQPVGMTLTVTSFGFARGMPPVADLVFDMRFLDNPHWVEELREQTGRDPAVAAHIEQDPAFRPEFERIKNLILSLIPRYAAQGRAYLTIAFGCTGGRHRSVYSAETMGKALSEAGYDHTVLHRNLSAPATDTIEGQAPRNG